MKRLEWENYWGWITNVDGFAKEMFGCVIASGHVEVHFWFFLLDIMSVTLLSA